MIQSLFANVGGQGPSAEEVGAYCARLRDVLSAGGGVSRVQVCTVARKPMAMVGGGPACRLVTALSDAEVDAIAARVTAETGLPAAGFYGR